MLHFKTLNEMNAFASFAFRIRGPAQLFNVLLLFLKVSQCPSKAFKVLITISCSDKSYDVTYLTLYLMVSIENQV